MTTIQLKKSIKKKFGKITKFTALVGIDRYEFQKLIAAAEKKMTQDRQLEINKFGELVRTTKAVATKEELTEDIRARIKAEIENQFGSVVVFCVASPDFAPTAVWHIIEGRRKRIGPTVKRLLNVLKISL